MYLPIIFFSLNLASLLFSAR